MKSRFVSIRLLRVMVCALPNSYFRTTGMELKRYSPSATARSMAVWAAVRFSVSFMNIGMLVSISWRVRISRHYKIFCVNVKYGIQYGFRIFYLIALQNEENYESEESCSA